MNDKLFIKSKVKKSLRKLFGDKPLKGHELVRMNILASMIASILVTNRSELLRMAAGNPERKKLGSKVKQYKRLLLNDKFNHKTHYLPFIVPLLSALAESGLLVFSIDGSKVGRGCMCLMFSVIYNGRAIPVVWKTYKQKKGHLPESEHRALLKRLSEMVPEGCRVVVTGDGEFDGCDWMDDLEGLGWDYVLKTSRNTLVEDAAGYKFKTGEALPRQGAEMFFEGALVTRRRHLTNVMVWHGKGYAEPLYLVTNLDYPPEIKQLYKKRFKIEPFFRDQKSKGFHIQKSGLSDPKRLDKLLIATCLAYSFCIMAGVKACSSKFYAEFAREDGNWLSLFQVGYRFIKFLVDIRQWRAFSVSRDIPPEKNQLGNLDICVPF